MARFMVKASEYKNVCKAVNDRKLAELKKEIIEILKKQDEKEFKKAVDLFESQEMHYTHLEKSITGKWVEKAGYGVGTVRIWKGKKYKKIAPGKWARVFDKEGRGTNIAIGKLIAKVQKIDNVEDLMALVMANKQRFVDENGVDLPVLDKLRAAVDARNENVGSKETSKPAANKMPKSKNDSDFDEESYKRSKKKLEETIADIDKKIQLFDSNPTPNGLRMAQQLENQKREWQNQLDNLEEQAKKNEKPAEKKKTFKQEMNELYDAQDKAWEGFESGSEIKSTPENSKKFYDRVKKFVDDNNIKLSKKHYDEIEDQNGHSFNEALALAGAYGEGAKKKELARNKEYSQKYKGQILDLSMIDEFKESDDENKTYWIQDNRGNRLTNEDAKKKIIGQMKYLAELEDMAGKKINNRTANDIRYYIDYLKDRLNPEDRKEIESIEKENKKKELSMKEKVLIATDEGSKKELGRGKMYKKHITEIQKIANSNINDIPENLKTINDFVKYQDSLDNPDYKQAGKDYARLKNHELAREIWQKVEDGEAEWDENGYLKLDENGLLAKPEKKEESKQKTLSEKIKVSEELSNNHQKAVEKVIEEVKKELGAEKTERGLTYKNSYSGDFKNYKGGDLGRSYHSMINGAAKVESDYNGKPINYLTHDIEWSNSKNIDEYIDKLQERYDKKLKERKEHGIWNTNHAYWGEILEDAIKLQALKDIRDNGLLLTKEEINSYEDEIKAESERKEKESKRINTVIDYYEEESETNPNLDKKELVKIYDAIENGKDTSKFNQHDVEGMAAFMGVDLKKVKKSFDDRFLLDMAVEDEIQKVEEEQEEESLFDDYSAEHPGLFNSTTMKVQEAFNRCKVL